MSSTKRRPHPFMPPFSERAPGDGRFSEPTPAQPVAALDEEDDETDSVICALSGRRIKRTDAVHVRIGPNRTMWIAADLTSSAR